MPDFKNLLLSSEAFYFLMHLYEKNYITFTADIKICNQQKLPKKRQICYQEKFKLHISNILMVNICEIIYPR